MRASLRFLAAGATLVAASCASGSIRVRSAVPVFYRHPPTSREYFFGIGEGKGATLTRSRGAALSNARDDVARRIRSTVRSVLTGYAATVGEATSGATDLFIERVTRRVVEYTLAGVRIEKLEPARDGTVYALVSCPVVDLLRAAKQEFTRDASAAFPEFAPKKALELLDAELGIRHHGSAGR